jgi:competence protein ComEA
LARGEELVDWFRERLARLERRQLIGLLAVGGLVIGVAVTWYLRSIPSPVTISEDAHVQVTPAVVQVTPAAAPTESAGSAPSTGSGQPSEIVVDVAGRVRNPGVYTFHPGDRVIDAIRRAGGALPGADLMSLNLAAPLTDAEQIIVGRADGKGPPSSTTSAGGSGTGGTSGGGSTGEPPRKVNINTASLEELDSLPGIGPVLAQRIIDYRTQHGPFQSVQDLLDVPGIGDSHLADLEPLVIVS